MHDGHTISQVAARTGFSASALRFYEAAGLITPQRSNTGYRLYDERSIARLRFIGQAKRLGLSLEEIADLVPLWDGAPCSTVAARLGGLVDDKIRDARTRIAELVELTTDLQRARAAMWSANDEPCGDGCACRPVDAAAPPVGVALLAKPAPADAPTLACTLAPEHAMARVDEWQALLARSSTRTAITDGVLFRFPADPALAAEVARLAAAEQACCAFSSFTVHMDPAGTTLTVTAPADASALLDALFGATA